jgi:hypothetical protein
MQLDVSIFIPWSMAGNELYNQQPVDAESYVTNLSLPVTGNIHG